MPQQEFRPRTWYADNAPSIFAMPPPDGDIEADVAVIGGGFAGLNIALGLIERGAGRVAVLEARQPGFGASGRNGGFVFGGYSLDPRELLRQAGRERARELYGWTRDAVELIRRRADEWQLDCGIVEGGVLWADWFHRRCRLLEFRDWLARELGVQWDFIEHSELRRRVKSPVYGDGLLERNAFHFNPLRYLRGVASRIMAQGGVVHEHTPVTEIKHRADGWLLETPAGCVRCGQAVIATGGYGPKIVQVPSPPSRGRGLGRGGADLARGGGRPPPPPDLAHAPSLTLPRKRGRGEYKSVQRCIAPIATYVMATEPLHERAPEVLDAPWAVYDTRFAFDYYRLLPDTRLLWGGRISIREPEPRRLEKQLRRDLLKVFPQLENVAIDYRWSGRMSYARHQMPVLGQSAPGLWHAIGFGGHGMAPTTVAGEVMAEAITGDTRRLEAFANWPARRVWGRLGLLGVQLTYWGKQGIDRLRKARLEVLGSRL